MRRPLTTILFLAFCLLPEAAGAQVLPPLTTISSQNSLTAPLPGEVDIVVEGQTYVPAFYQGRAEPTAGNTVRLVAVPIGAPAGNFTYQWRVNGQALNTNGPVGEFKDMLAREIRVSVTVISGGTAWARADDLISLSEARVVFYEQNLLRGHGSKAISGTYTLVGDEGAIRAEPYFIGLQATANTYLAAWSVNGQEVESGGDWRELWLQRPEDPLPNYRIEFSADNLTNFGESVSGSFNLNFGL